MAPLNIARTRTRVNMCCSQKITTAHYAHIKMNQQIQKSIFIIFLLQTNLIQTQKLRNSW